MITKGERAKDPGYRICDVCGSAWWPTRAMPPGAWLIDEPHDPARHSTFAAETVQGQPAASEHGPFPDIERMYAEQGGRLPCEGPPLIVKDGKYVPYDPEAPERPLDRLGCPDLHELVDRAGRRHAASIGEEYVEEPLDEKGKLKRPQHQGGYQHITAAEWAEYDRAMAAWQAARRPLP